MTARLLLYLAAAAAIGGLLWIVDGWRRDSNKLEAAETALETATDQYDADIKAIQDRATDAAKQAKADQKTAQTAASEAARIQLERDMLLARLAELKSAGRLIVEVPRENACPDVRRSPEFRMHFNTAVSGATADSAQPAGPVF